MVCQLLICLLLGTFNNPTYTVMFQLYSVNSDKNVPPWTSSHLLSRAELCKQWSIISYLLTFILGITSSPAQLNLVIATAWDRISCEISVLTAESVVRYLY